MRYISTRGQVDPVTFQQVVLKGLADDGGLMIPESIPDVSDQLQGWADLAYPELAARVMEAYTTDLPHGDLSRLLEETYGLDYGGPVAPLVRVGPLHVLELFHGPTLSFKDVALQFLGNVFEYILERGGGRLNVLGATSGDTGSAAIYGCRGRSRIQIFMMHPRGRVSPIQERQMTTVLDENVHNIAVEGSFDDCQRIVKELAGDLDFKTAYSLGAVNSINWARVMAQTVYYFHAFFEVRRRTGAEAIRVAVPTGNFGNILAGWYAMKMGLPIRQLVLATNENDILARFFQSGRYERGTLHQTLSPAMDIQVASNFERYLYYRVGEDPARLRELMQHFEAEGALQVEPDEDGRLDPDFAASVGTVEDCLGTIAAYHDRYDYVLDPHTAVGIAVAERLGLDDLPVVCVATAHPAKFPAAVQRAVGRDVAHHPRIDSLMDLPTRCAALPNDAEDVRRFIVEIVG